MHCESWIRTDISSSFTPSGYGPTSLQTAYNLTGASLANGANQTIAIVDAQDDPKAEADLGIYRSTFSLPPCTTANGCFMKVNETGVAANYPAPDVGWAEEISLDLDMASAICPNCEIVLVEATSQSNTDFYTAEDTAATTCGATVISNSWDGNEYNTETSDEVHFNHPGVMIAFASGDKGYINAADGYPVSSKYVTAVGGTTLCTAPLPGACGGSPGETVWAGSGSDCSVYIAQPAWQAALASITAVCSTRVANDVAAEADPSTGVAIYDTYSDPGWLVFGGTSAATPIVASVYALAGNGAGITAGSYSYSHTSSFNDITSGGNGSCAGVLLLCNAGPGYDGPTGNGSPNGIGGF
jgi:subtilase family serine protease